MDLSAQLKSGRLLPNVIEAIDKKYGLNKPVTIQYLHYMNNLLHGDLGISFEQRDVSVNEIVAHGFPASARVGSLAVLIALLLGIPFGIISAIQRGKCLDRFSMVLATIGISVPCFVLSFSCSTCLPLC